MSRRLVGAVGVVVVFLAGAWATWGATYTTPRALAVGDIYEMRRDNWTAPPGGALYDGDVEPKVDLNTGTDGDNRYYQRHNVVRAWPTDTGYW